MIVGDDGQIKRSSDDGEPSGTAGVPMLTVLEKQGLTNVVAVVTRYFGGIKLGTGGLIRAYSGSVAHAIEEIGRVEVKELTGLTVELTYSQYQSLPPNFLEKEGLQELIQLSYQMFLLLYLSKSLILKTWSGTNRILSGES